MGQGATAHSLTGGNGGVYIDDTSAHTGNFMALKAVGTADAVVNNSGTTSNIEDFDANITIPLGTTLEGSFTSVTLVSGAVVAYNR